VLAPLLGIPWLDDDSNHVELRAPRSILRLVSIPLPIDVEHVPKLEDDAEPVLLKAPRGQLVSLPLPVDEEHVPKLEDDAEPLFARAPKPHLVSLPLPHSTDDHEHVPKLEDDTELVRLEAPRPYLYLVGLPLPSNVDDEWRFTPILPPSGVGPGGPGTFGDDFDEKYAICASVRTAPIWAITTTSLRGARMKTAPIRATVTSKKDDSKKEK
jgi:hypothetical protein